MMESSSGPSGNAACPAETAAREWFCGDVAGRLVMFRVPVRLSDFPSRYTTVAYVRGKILRFDADGVEAWYDPHPVAARVTSTTDDEVVRMCMVVDVMRWLQAEYSRRMRLSWDEAARACKMHRLHHHSCNTPEVRFAA